MNIMITGLIKMYLPFILLNHWFDLENSFSPWLCILISREVHILLYHGPFHITAIRIKMKEIRLRLYLNMDYTWEESKQ